MWTERGVRPIFLLVHCKISQKKKERKRKKLSCVSIFLKWKQREEGVEYLNCFRVKTLECLLNQIAEVESIF